MVTTPKKSGEQTWTWSGAGFTRQTPSEKQTAAPESSLLYKRARYYDPNTGEFISRDPLGFVDGMSQYRAYFTPGGVDPSGLQEAGISFPGFFTVSSNSLGSDPFPIKPNTGTATKLFAKGLLCTAEDAKNIEITDYSYIRFSVDWDYTLTDAITVPDNRSDFEKKLDAVNNYFEPKDATHRYGDHRPGSPSISVQPFYGCEDDCLRMRIQINHKAKVRALQKGHELYKNAVSAYDRNAGPMTFGVLVRHEWDHARTYYDGLFSEYKKLEPLMEKKFETVEEWNRVAKCVSAKAKAMAAEANAHSLKFDTLEHYKGHYEKFPFKPNATFDECLQ